MVTSTYDSLKVVNSGYITTAAADAFLFVISDSDYIVKGYQVSFSPPYSPAIPPSTTVIQNSILTGTNQLRRLGLAYVFAGYTTGFMTSNQNVIFANTLPNTFVMQYLMDKPNNY